MRPKAYGDNLCRPRLASKKRFRADRRRGLGVGIPYKEWVPSSIFVPSLCKEVWGLRRSRNPTLRKMTGLCVWVKPLRWGLARYGVYVRCVRAGPDGFDGRGTGDRGTLQGSCLLWYTLCV